MNVRLAARALCAARAVTMIAMTATIAMIAAPAAADINIPLPPGSAGTDGVFAPAQSVTIDLRSAVTGDWTQPGTGVGVYDPTQWAVVFKYSSVSIPANVTVTFTNHVSGAPVVWLVDGDVTIEGVVNLRGQDGHAPGVTPTFAEPGPGGFRGGKGSSFTADASPGFGPGGAQLRTNSTCGGGSGGGHRTVGAVGSQGLAGPGGGTYGNELVMPLIGGSGACGVRAFGSSVIAPGGGAGGGAILIAAKTTLTLGSGAARVQASGGNVTARSFIACSGGDADGAGGAGGAIRLVADSLSGPGALSVLGGTAVHNGVPGGDGRVRLEANTINISVPGNATTGIPTDPVRIFPDASVPFITAVSLNGEPISADPSGDFMYPGVDVGIGSGQNVILEVAAVMLPTNSTMQVRVTPRDGAALTAPATFHSGDSGSSTWRATLNLPDGFSAIQVRAVLP